MAKVKSIGLSKSANVVMRRMEKTKDTKNYRAFGITDDMKESANANGVSGKLIGQVTGGVYLRSGTDFAESDEVYVIITDVPPSKFEDIFADTEDED